MNAAPIRALVVADHPVLREGLSLLVANAAGLAVAGVGSDATAAAAACRSESPDVTLPDLRRRDVDAPLDCPLRDGHRNKRIARLMNISDTTVASYSKNTVQKLRAADRIRAVVIALRKGLLQV